MNDITPEKLIDILKECQECNFTPKIFNIIKGANYDVVLFTDAGEKTLDSAEATRFYVKEHDMMISLRSMEITSPVSSSTKSSCQVFKTRAASLRSITFFNPVLETFTSSARSNISKISLSLSYPIALKSVVTGNFFLRSI